MTEQTDRELLEMAAKAAGLRVKIWGGHTGTMCSIDDDRHGGMWMPLADDGDAFRLAVALRLTVSWDRFDDCDYATATPRHTHQGYDCIVDQDPAQAARRAITRAAAAIGEAMP